MSCQVFDYNGKLVRVMESVRAWRRRLPTGVAIDAAGNWLLTEPDSLRVVVFRADGSVLTTFGDRGRDEELLGIAVDRDGRIFLTSVGVRLCSRLAK